MFDNLDIDNGSIYLGDLEFNQGNFIQQPQNVDSLISSNLPEGIGIPLLERPTDLIFDLLLGNSTDLITYSTPKFEFEETIGETIPILGPLGVFVGGNFDIEAQFSFGFDSYGLSTGFLEDGFYINDRINGEDTQEVTFNIGPRLGPGVQVGAVSLATFLGYLGGIGLNWNDDDGRFRLNELNEILVDSFKPFELFDLGINLRAGFGGEVNLAGVTLWRPEINGNIQIAEISGSEIQNTSDQLLSAGADAANFISEIYNIFATGNGFTQTLEFAKYLFNEVSVGLEDIGKILANELSISAEDVTRILWELGLRDISRIAEILVNEAGRALEEVADAFVRANDILNQGSRELAQALEGLASTPDDLAKALFNGAGFTVETIADAFNDGLGFNPTSIADALWGNGFFSGVNNGAAELARILDNEIVFSDYADDFAKALFNGAGFTVETIADVFDDDLGFSPTFITDALWGNGFFSGVNNGAAELARILDNEIVFSDYADDFAKALFNGAGFTVETIADVFDDDLGFSPTFITDALWGNGFFSGVNNGAAELARILDNEIVFSDYADDFAKALFNGAGFTVETIADVFDDDLGFSPTFITDALWGNGFFSGVNNGAAELARILDNEIVFSDYADDFAKALFNGAGFTVETIADVFDDDLGFSPTFITDALWGNGFFSGFGNNGAAELARILDNEIVFSDYADDFAKALFNGAGFTVEIIADVFDDNLDFNPNFIADALWGNGFFSGFSNGGAELTRVLRGEGISTEEIVGGLSSIGFNSGNISNAFSSIGINISSSGISNFLSGTTNTIISNVSNVGSDIFGGIGDLF